jgi:hypothetical protein
MLEIIINKVLFMVLIMSCLNIARHTYYFIQAWVKSNSENPEKYIVNNKSLWILSVSIAYVLTTMFFGVSIN